MNYGEHLSPSEERSGLELASKFLSVSMTIIHFLNLIFLIIDINIILASGRRHNDLTFVYTAK